MHKAKERTERCNRATLNLKNLLPQPVADLSWAHPSTTEAFTIFGYKWLAQKERNLFAVFVAQAQ